MEKTQSYRMPRTTEMDVVQREREDSSEGSVQILSRLSSTPSFRRPSLATGWKNSLGTRPGQKKEVTWEHYTLAMDP